MSHAKWRIQWKRPSIAGWCLRIVLLAFCIWLCGTSYRAWHGKPLGWPNDPDVYVKKPMDPEPPVILFFGRRFCLNLNKSDLPIMQQGLQIRYAMYVYGSGSPNGLAPPWQLFKYGFVMPTWALCALFTGALLFLSRPHIFRRIRAGHCSNCNYNLKGLESASCPECGTKP